MPASDQIIFLGDDICVDGIWQDPAIGRLTSGSVCGHCRRTELLS